MLSAKAAQGEIVVVRQDRARQLSRPRTSAASSPPSRLTARPAVITPEVNEVVVKSARNLPGVTTAPAKLINVYDLLNAKTLVIDKEALAVIEEVFA